MIDAGRNSFKKAEKVPRNPLQVYLIREQEKEFAMRESQEIQEGHGPVRVLMQGGKKCNVVIK